MSFVKLYTVYKDIKLITGNTPSHEREYIIRLQQLRDSELLTRFNYENIPTFPMEFQKFNDIKYKFIKLSSYESRLCLLFVYPDKVIGLSSGEEIEFTNIEAAYTHYCNISADKKIKHFPVKVY
jgi:hypothetical protein